MTEDEERARDRRWTLLAGGVMGGLVAFSVLVAFVILPLAQAPAAGIDAWTAICRAVGVSPGTPARPQTVSTAVAEPVSRVQWSPAIIDIVSRADPGPGASVAAATCYSCHGEEGVSPSGDYPHLSGQSAAAIYKQLSDYRSGTRVHPLMSPFAQQLTEDQLAEVAAYYSRASRDWLGDRTPLDDPLAAELANRGDPERGIPACASCHGVAVGGPIETPTLTGQHHQYLAAQLQAYRDGTRRNDVYRRMRDIAAHLTDDEITRLAAYYEGLR